MRTALLSLLPSQCEVCRRWGSARLCADCRRRFSTAGPRCQRCQRCGLRLALPAPACGECLRDPPPFERTVCAVDYAFPWDHLVVRFKFHGQVELAGALAELLVDGLRLAGAPWPQVVVPVPLSRQRLQERGYNQAWELGRHLASIFSIEAHADLLRRAVDTPHQAELTRAQRRQNLRSAFFVAPQGRPLLQGRRVALVDDVMTTGTTAREASATLLRAGAAAVDLWVLARTSEN